MKKLIFLFVCMYCMSSFAQRLEVATYSDLNKYKKNYSHIIDGGTLNDSTFIFIAGNMTDKASEAEYATGHKLFDMVALKNKKGRPYQKWYLLTDFTIHPISDLNYAAGTGIYLPDGPEGMGYPFLGLYDRDDMQLVYFYWFDISYPLIIEDTTHAVGLRVAYSADEEAFYICGTMADRMFQQVEIYDIEVKTKGFILKYPVDGYSSPSLLVFSPDVVEDDALLNIIGDIEINEGETKIAFTGLNTKSSLTGYHHAMTGIVDMDLAVQWCLAYEEESSMYTGIDVAYNEDDTTLFVLHNSTGDQFSVMEVKQSDGSVVQGPWAYEFSSNFTSDDTTRIHMMHYYDDTLVLTGNHFAEIDNSMKQFVFRFDLDADNLNQYFCNLTYYAEQDYPDGNQIPAGAYWTSENSVYIDDTLHLVGVLNEPENEEFGFEYIRTPGISSNCVNTLEPDSTELSVDTVSCTATLDECSKTSLSVQYDNAPIDTTLECVGYKTEAMFINGTIENQDFWEVKRIDRSGIEIGIISAGSTAYNITVYDLMGRKVYETEESVMSGNTNIYLNFQMKPQTYIIRVSNGKNAQTKKVVNVR